MIRKIKKKEKIDFLLQNKHYQRLQLYLYILSLFVIVITYFLTILIFSSYSPNYIITGIFSIIIGLYLVFNRDKLVKKISEKIEDCKRKKLKKENKSALKTTLRKITPQQNKIKLNIKPKETIKEKFHKIKHKLKKKDSKTKEYIEIK